MRRPYEAPKVTPVKCSCLMPSTDPPPGKHWTHANDCPLARLEDRDTIPSPAPDPFEGLAAEVKRELPDDGEQ
jgi:hypothetical protein